MIDRWIPLSLLAVNAAFLLFRLRLQARRYGGRQVHFGRGPDPLQRWTERVALLALLAFAVLAILAGLGRVELAASAVQRAAGGAIGFGSAGLMFVAQLQLGQSWRIGIDPDARTPLVTHGLYRFCRNPIFALMVATFLGFALLLPNAVTWTVIAGLFLGVRAQTLREERWLRATYGAAWVDYAARTGRFVHFAGRIRR